MTDSTRNPGDLIFFCVLRVLIAVPLIRRQRDHGPTIGNYGLPVFTDIPDNTEEFCLHERLYFTIRLKVIFPAVRSSLAYFFYVLVACLRII